MFTEQEVVNTQHVNIILNHWKCECLCPNKSGYCYIIDNVHLQLFAQNIKIWSMAINEGTADSEMPSKSLGKSLQSSKLSLKNFKRKSSTKSYSDTILLPSPYYPPYNYPGYPPYF